MNNRTNERLLNLAVEIGQTCDRLPNTRFGNQIPDQLVRSGTSPGPNYEEACAAESRKDFIHKISIALKELRESYFWLRLIVQSRLIPDDLSILVDECRQLLRIFGKSVTTARRNDPSGKAWRHHS
ncbi:MAG: four helix bundle protein [Gemmatimonadetes bacterium]|nr:four helix bundle protein [Gemmatimonadota bacterium]